MEGMATKVANDFKLLSNEKQNIIAERMDICLNCPYNSRNARTSQEFKELYNASYGSDRKEFHCSLCSCILEFKTASLSSNCGIESWNTLHPNRKLELKWHAVEGEKGESEETH